MTEIVQEIMAEDMSEVLEIEIIDALPIVLDLALRFVETFLVLSVQIVLEMVVRLLLLDVEVHHSHLFQIAQNVLGPLLVIQDRHHLSRRLRFGVKVLHVKVKKMNKGKL